jgi:hypothetical protein
VQAEQAHDLGLFQDIPQTLERIGARYMIIGAFAASVYGITRVTYDIDIVVDLSDEHVDKLVEAYPPPRFYADPVQMRDSIDRGMMFNIIDGSRGEKADLVPLTAASGYQEAFQRRIRQRVEVPGGDSFDVWCARPEDVILGKLMAWTEGRSRKHETDILEILVSHSRLPGQSPDFELDESYVDERVGPLGVDTAALWTAIKRAAKRETDQLSD